MQEQEQIDLFPWIAHPDHALSMNDACWSTIEGVRTSIDNFINYNGTKPYVALGECPVWYESSPLPDYINLLHNPNYCWVRLHQSTPSKKLVQPVYNTIDRARLTSISWDNNTLTERELCNYIDNQTSNQDIYFISKEPGSDTYLPCILKEEDNANTIN